VHGVVIDGDVADRPTAVLGVGDDTDVTPTVRG
jgi:hypothetical protein